jgi:hypothetical protein
MIPVAVWRVAIAAAVVLTALPLVHSAAWRPPLGQASLFSPSPTLQAYGVYVLVVMSAFAGLARKGNVLAVLFFVAGLAGAIADARFSVVFAAIAAPMLVERRVP